MIIEEALNTVETLIQPQTLSNVQELVFRQCWEGETYAEIAANHGYDTDYIRYVGCQLWQLLSRSLGKKVTKSNICSVLRCRTFQSPAVISSPYTADNFDSAIENEIFHADVDQVSVELNQHPGWTEAVDVSVFYDRHQEQQQLKQWILQERCRLVALLGMGGIGKTALAAILGKQIQAEFDLLIWRSLRNAPPIEDFLAELLQFFPNQQEAHLPKTLDAKLAQLIDCLRSSRCLLVLDNAESILQSGERCGRYREGYAGYGQLIRQIGETQHQSCVVLTSREKPISWGIKEGNLPVRSLQLTGLPEVYAQQLLEFNGIVGSPDEVRSLIEQYSGNPLTLKIVATTIRDLFAGNISDFLAVGATVFDDIRKLLDQQFNRLSDLEKQVIYWLGMNREPVSLCQLQENIVPFVSKASLLEALLSLERRSLLENYIGRFSIPPLLVDYITEINLERNFQDSPCLNTKDVLNREKLITISSALPRRILG